MEIIYDRDTRFEQLKFILRGFRYIRTGCGGFWWRQDNAIAEEGARTMMMMTIQFGKGRRDVW